MLTDQNTKKSNATELSESVFDVIIIGAGIVGCAMARRFVLEGAHVALVEKASDILDGASKANSAILHTGFDAPPQSVELSCIKAGHDEYLKIHHDLGLPLEKTGAHVVAWSSEEEDRLPAIVEKAHGNGIKDVAIISAAQLANAEPELANHAKAAINIPRESIIDPWSAPYAYLKQALMNGGEAFLSCELVSGRRDGSQWELGTSRGILRAKTVINCAGLYGDRIDDALIGERKFKITPRKGQFVVFDKAAARLVKSVILPVPTPRTKGVVVCRTIFGNLLVGPTAEDQQSRDDASTTQIALRELIKAGIAKLPALENIPVTAVYAGLRPACEFKDYQIASYREQGWISVGAIRSTGLSGALGIALHVFGLYKKFAESHKKIPNPQIPVATILAQDGERAWRSASASEIVCHCELVTKNEIDAALCGPLAAHSLAGLKRQTRVTMGRCQGFYCSARLAQLTRGKFEIAMSEAIDDA